MPDPGKTSTRVQLECFIFDKARTASALNSLRNDLSSAVINSRHRSMTGDIRTTNAAFLFSRITLPG
jgi:hypothetical protein